MYYEFYLDVYFLENLMMNFFVLQMTGHVLRIHTGVWRKVLCAAGGSLTACILVLLPVRRHVFLSALISFLAGNVMAAAGCGTKIQNEKKTTITVFWITVLFFSAVWQFFIQILQMSFFFSVPIGYGVVRLLWKTGKKKKQKQQYLYDVRIVHHQKEIQIKALLDSGNQLRQPITGRPVHIIDASVVRNLLNEGEISEMECMMRLESPEKGTGTFSYVPFHTIGNDCDLMPVLILEMLQIKHGESAQNTKQILAAVSKRTLSSSGEYQMILHPQILE